MWGMQGVYSIGPAGVYIVGPTGSLQCRAHGSVLGNSAKLVC